MARGGFSGLALALLLSGVSATAQDAGGTGSAIASVVEPVRVEAVSDLDFGCIAVSGDGSVRVSALTGIGTYLGGVTRFDSGNACLTGAAEFRVTGQQGREYRIAIDPNAEARKIDDPAISLAVTRLAGVSANQPDMADAGRLDDDGRDTLRVGGTLEVSADTAPGRYVAKIAVTVSYN